MKIIRIFALFFSILALTSCSSFKGYIKKSANEEVFDTKGFEGKKRMPMYNAKYIKKAKDNLVTGSLDDESEVDNPYYETNELNNYHETNRKMYQDMVEMNRSKQNLSYKKSYPKLIDIDKDHKEKKEKEALTQEIESIKKILNDTREKLSNQKCSPEAEVNNKTLPTHKLPKAEVSNKETFANMINLIDKELPCSKISNSKMQQCR